jgi:N-acetyl-anhydromuramyl-L-alanine amidase AmpD
MGREYGPAQDMFVDESRTFIGALKNNKDLSIVIHGSGSPGDVVPTADEIALYFASNKQMVSSHFVIGRDGKIVQCVSLNDGAAANCCLEPGYDMYWDMYEKGYGNLNKCTISIEHCNNADNSLPLTEAQKKASFELVQYLCLKYGIPPTRIKTHASLAPKTRKECPGNYPMDELIQTMTPKPAPKPKPKPKPDPQPTISEQQLLSELDQMEKELQALRGMITVNKPTVIE